MGIEIEAFVYPDRISEELICPICHNVVENPVQTPTEHLFCEDELLEWLVQSTICPVTNTPLDASTIKPPGRLISNMLSSLERYCPNKGEGCEWTGKSDQVKGHYKSCNKKSRSSLVREMEEKDILIALLKGKISASNQKYAKLESENNVLKSENEKLLKKIHVYDAFFNHSDEKMGASGNSMGGNDQDKYDSPRGGQSVADDKHERGGPPRQATSDASNLAKLRNFEKKSVYL
mmetsp:Transcript_25440/g.42886  ORF Transcript_25440/g.42886 Transcript_25440/m.42886 type:complete len:234 (-) Transcript_25440:127-828(-)